TVHDSYRSAEGGGAAVIPSEVEGPALPSQAEAPPERILQFRVSKQGISEQRNEGIGFWLLRVPLRPSTSLRTSNGLRQQGSDPGTILVPRARALG
ncbi:MAG: hypothetical protein ACRD88_20535, partial [Terriglobia bacterium]